MEINWKLIKTLPMCEALEETNARETLDRAEPRGPWFTLPGGAESRIP